GISVHRSDCPNVLHPHGENRERIIKVSWNAEGEGIYQARIEAVAIDRPRLAMDIMTAITDTKTIINAVNARATKNGLAAVDLKVEIRGLEHLEYIMNKIRKVKDVMEVRRVTPT
ncbi:MAG: bifunctional (p)ppGpp synthetase/guanosine-3',5'-bis(diphosphate) 3'-pyrophosphohydrolase, partial [Clostridia bacterium]|nr:bifunctional (p)ppGpp synthetase/guanosine-3',5'-bis(diphosphate) 3'-pyrophosphohydrolase [Clostridia bacterium]